MRFDRIADPKEQKQILEQIFGEVFFHCKKPRPRGEHHSISLLNASFVALVSPLDPQFGQTINLEVPFRIDGTPEGFRKCKICSAVKPLDAFKGGSRRCGDCLTEGSRERWKRHNAKKCKF